jgi:hypothetical protein
MRNYILVFLFFICQHSGFAKEGNSSLKPLFTYYMELGSQYHLNKVDLKGLSGNSQLLGVSNSPGLSANLGLHVKYRSKMTTDFSIGASTFRGALQFIQPSLSGFESLVIEHRNFQQYYFLFKFLVGRSFKLTSRNSLEAQLGFQAFTSLRNKSEQKSSLSHFDFCTTYESRTRHSSVKGRRLNRLTNAAFPVFGSANVHAIIYFTKYYHSKKLHR